MDTTTQTLIGTVSRINSHGFQIAGGADWLNLSKFAKPSPSMPTVGQKVKVALDGRGFVRAVESVEEPKPAATPKRTPLAERELVEEVANGQAPGPDRRISRQACLNTATAILSSGARAVDAADVVALAAQLERWVYRPVK